MAGTAGPRTLGPNGSNAAKKFAKMMAARIRFRRSQLNMTQSELGAALHVSYQQIQKYEAGQSGHGAFLIMRLSEIMGVPVNYFYAQGTRYSRPVLPGERAT